MTRLSPAPPGRASAGDQPAVLAAIACYTLWGLLPLLFIAMSHRGVSPWEILAQRTVWSVLWALPLVLLARQGTQALRVLSSPRTLAWLTASALMIATNWTLYVWVVSRGHSLEASLGYYLNPLLNMAVGALLFGERMTRVKAVAIGLAGVGVLVQGAALGHMPWTGLALAASFCAYGVIRKRVDADAQTGLLVECLVLATPGLVYTLWLGAHGQALFGSSPMVTILLLLTGPATVAPLALFAWSARRLPLSTLGFIQFIAPTGQFIIGLATGEAMSPLRALSFVFIWAGVAVFVWGALRPAAALQRDA